LVFLAPVDNYTGILDLITIGILLFIRKKQNLPARSFAFINTWELIFTEEGFHILKAFS
jgi:hypothetical protein